MSRALALCALLWVPAFSPAADPPPAPTETVIRLALHPAAAPVPAFKYHLLPELAEITPGNPIQGYLKCFMEQNHFFFNKESVEEREKLRTLPLKELPAKDLLQYGGSALRQADQAARLETPDWQVLMPLKRAGFHLPLPDVQQMRMLSSGLQVRGRAQIAAGRFDDAIGTATTTFALARHLAEHPTLIGELVGMAVAGQAIVSLEEMIGQPGSPNLYWALTDLPSPFIDLRKGCQGERMVLKNEWDLILDPFAPVTPETRQFARSLADPPKALLDDNPPLTDDVRLARAIGRLRLVLVLAEEDVPKEEIDIRMWLHNRKKDEPHFNAARKRLADSGVAPDKLKQLQPWQVILMDEKLATETHYDEMAKAFALPYWEAEPILLRLSVTKDKHLLRGFVGPNLRVRMAQARLAQRLALLRTLEALRLHAAGHDGQLPARLDDAGVPIPSDPVTGRPFVYERKGTGATLRGTPPKGMENIAGFNVRYEITGGR